MRKTFLFLLFLFILLGCKRKTPELSKQEPISPEIASLIDTTNITSEEQNLTLNKEEPPIFLPPPGPYKPTNKQIQTALKNAGFYNGPIDGVIGPKTLKAIKEFQEKNNLKVDGKVGPKTWELLSRYLNNTPSESLPKLPKD